VRTHVYKAPRAACASCVYRTQCASKRPSPQWGRSITRIEESAGTSAFKAKMQSEAAHNIYHQRSQIAEFPYAWIFPHAWIKKRCGLRQFRCREQETTGMETKWAYLSYNMIRLFRIRRKIANATIAAA
jgi:Transposase DDE domain